MASRGHQVRLCRGSSEYDRTSSQPLGTRSCPGQTSNSGKVTVLSLVPKTQQNVMATLSGLILLLPRNLKFALKSELEFDKNLAILLNFKQPSEEK